MEDPEEDWGMEEEYYCPYPCSSGEDEYESKGSWLWNRGLNLGKKVVFTGVVISSAPIVLPPLVVVSALGFAVSVPFGVMYASYTCTLKLMSKLLPIPVSPPPWEHGGFLADEEPEFGGEIVMETEVKKEDNEVMIEFAEDENEGESFKDKGYEEDVGEYWEVEDKGSKLGGLDTKTEGSEEEVDKNTLVEESKNKESLPEVKRVVVVFPEEKKSGIAVSKPDSGVVKGDKGVELSTSNEEHNVQQEGTTGLLEKIRDEGNAGESGKKNKKKNKHHHSKKSHGNVGKKEDKHGENVSEKMNEESGRKGGKTGPDVVAVDISSVTVSVKPAGNQGTATNGNHASEKSNATKAEPRFGERIQESRAIDSNVRDEKEGKSISSSAQRRETDETRISDDSKQAGFPKPKGGVVSKADAAKSSNKVTPSEEKIWDQINALRVIVGYKAACHKSCMEELKALYIFTGVEPPSSFDKPADLRDAEDKLHFLMSIVGVK